MFPRGTVQQPPVVLQGPRTELVSPLLRLLESPAPGIHERGERRVVDEQPVVLIDDVPEVLGIGRRLHGRLAGLLGEPRHEEEVEAAAPVPESVGQGLLYGLVSISLAKCQTDGFIERVRRELDGPTSFERTVYVREMFGAGTIE